MHAGEGNLIGLGHLRASRGWFVEGMMVACPLDRETRRHLLPVGSMEIPRAFQLS